MHYGTLGILLPIVGWVSLSANVDKKIAVAVGIVLVALFARAYVANFEWRMSAMSEWRASIESAESALRGREDPATVAKEHIRQFYYVDSADTRQMVSEAIPILRQSMTGKSPQ
jgi:hypothetical protein